MELIIIACVLGYLFVSPDKGSLAFSRGLAGAARGAVTGKSPKDRKTKKRKPSPRQRAMLDGWREGVTTARERREAGKDLWSRGTRGAGRVSGGTGSLARGIKTSIDARRARSADPDAEATDPTPDSDVPGPVVDQDGNTVTVQDDQDAQPVEPTEPTDLAGTKLCAACKQVPVAEGEICGQCQYRQKLHNQHHDPQHESAIEDPDANGSASQTQPGPVIGSDFHQSTTTSPNGATPMSIAKTELNHLEDLAKEVKTVEAAIEGIAEAMEIARKWGVDLPERYAAAGWGTAGLDAAVTTCAETMGQLKFPAVTEAMGNIQAQIAEARGVGEVVSAHRARGNAEAFAGQ